MRSGRIMLMRSPKDACAARCESSRLGDDERRLRVD
jgi:hypothetical protein